MYESATSFGLDCEHDKKSYNGNRATQSTTFIQFQGVATPIEYNAAKNKPIVNPMGYITVSWNPLDYSTTSTNSEANHEYQEINRGDSSTENR